MGIKKINNSGLTAFRKDLLGSWQIAFDRLVGWLFWV